MKRSEMAEKLEAYIHKEFSLYDGLLNQANGMLQFLEDQGMRLCHPLFHGMVLAWDAEEEPKPTPEEQMKALVKAHMLWGYDKTHTWYHQPNPLLGGLTPNDMVSQGRQDKLIKWIKSQIDENDHGVIHEQWRKDLAQQEEQDKPKLPQKGAVKRITAASKATQAKFKRHRKKT